MSRLLVRLLVSGGVLALLVDGVLALVLLTPRVACRSTVIDGWRVGGPVDCGSQCAADIATATGAYAERPGALPVVSASVHAEGVRFSNGDCILPMYGAGPHEVVVLDLAGGGQAAVGIYWPVDPDATAPWVIPPD